MSANARLSRWPILLLALLLSLLGAGAASVQGFAEKIAPLIDPAKLLTLGERGANSRVQKAVYFLERARQENLTTTKVMDAALKQVRYPTPFAAQLTRKALLGNLASARRYGCLDAAGLEQMQHGQSPTIRTGPSAGQELSVDHVIPRAVVPELDNVIANLRFLPARKNASKNDKVNKAARKLADEFYQAGLLSRYGYGLVRSHR